MKKMLSLLLVLSLMLGCSVAMAEDLGVQIIGGKDSEMETLSLDDMKLGESYKISGFATIKPLTFGYMDWFPGYFEGKSGDNTTKEDWYPKDHASEKRVYTSKPNGNDTKWYYANVGAYESGLTADFAWLEVDITNLQKTAVDFGGITTVKVVYADEYEFSGWVRQINYDYSNSKSYLYGFDDKVSPNRTVVNPKDIQPIDVMYTGHYVFGCTLPNDVVEGKEPLRIEIKIGDNELTYNIRK